MDWLVVSMYAFIGLVVVVGGIGSIGALVAMSRQDMHESHH